MCLKLGVLTACKWLHRFMLRVKWPQMVHSVPTRCLSSGKSCLKSRCHSDSDFTVFCLTFFFQTSLQSLLHQEKVLQAQLSRLQGASSSAFLRHSVDSSCSTPSMDPGLGVSVPEPFRSSIVPALPPSKWSAPVTPPSSVSGGAADSLVYARSPPHPRVPVHSALSTLPHPTQYRFGSETLSTVILPSPLSAASTSSHQSRCVPSGL